MEGKPTLEEARFTVENGISPAGLEQKARFAQDHWLEVMRKKGYTCRSQMWRRGPFPALSFERPGVATSAVRPGRVDYVLQAYFSHRPIRAEVFVENTSKLKKEHGLWVPQH